GVWGSPVGYRGPCSGRPWARPRAACIASPCRAASRGAGSTGPAWGSCRRRPWRAAVMSEQLEQERSRIQEADDTIRQLQDALAKARARVDQAEDRSTRLNRDLCVIYHLADIPTAGDVVEAVAALKRQRDEAQEKTHQ